ncbi:MAG: hypothetical protein U9Q94_04260 [Candidatus Bipolaricaulota bacterium]|nr:hypothetical protein [Candidatus Bipolaricaulota bacterium]
MWRNLLRGRARHFVLLLPMGLVVGAVVGVGFHDVLFGLAAGAIFGLALGLLLTLQTH